MKVKELIEKLSKVNLDSVVYFERLSTGAEYGIEESKEVTSVDQDSIDVVVLT